MRKRRSSSPRALQRIIDGHHLSFDAATSLRMRGIRREGTEAELAVRAAVSRLGARFRVRNRDLPGSPDLANRTRGWAIFVHGCYWHRHRGCARTTTPSRNTEFWKAKFAANVARDRRVASELRRLGFRVLSIWECDSEDIHNLDDALRGFLKIRRTTN